MEIIAALQIFVGMLVLVAASGLFIHAITNISRIFKIGEYLIIFLILGFATTLPELFIGINAILIEQPGLALGNALGTSIASMSFIAGIVAIFSRKLNTRNFFHTRDLTHLSLSVVLLILLSSDGGLSRLDGLLLLIVFAYYLWNIYNVKSGLQLKIKESNKNLWVHLTVAGISGLAMYFAAQYTVFAADSLARVTLLPAFLIAIVLVAPLGAVPELIVELELIKHKLSSLSLADLFSSVVVNSTLIIGLLALINPFVVSNTRVFNFSALFLVILLILFNFLARSKESLDWKEGLFLLISYFFFIISTFLIQIA